MFGTNRPKVIGAIFRREMLDILRASEQNRFAYDGKHYQVPEMTVRPQALHRARCSTT